MNTDTNKTAKNVKTLVFIYKHIKLGKRKLQKSFYQSIRKNKIRSGAAESTRDTPAQNHKIKELSSDTLWDKKSGIHQRK